MTNKTNYCTDNLSQKANRERSKKRLKNVELSLYYHNNLVPVRDIATLVGVSRVTIRTYLNGLLDKKTALYREKLITDVYEAYKAGQHIISIVARHEITIEQAEFFIKLFDDGLDPTYRRATVVITPGGRKRYKTTGIKCDNCRKYTSDLDTYKGVVMCRECIMNGADKPTDLKTVVSNLSASKSYVWDNF